MNGRSIALLIGVLASTVLANPRCSLYYGQPDLNDCRKILTGSIRYRDGFQSIDALVSRPQTFIVAGITERPWDVSHVPWGFKQNIPQFFAPQQYRNCIAAILPVENAQQQLSYDTGRYTAMSAVGMEINRFCVGASGIPGAPSMGGIEVAGDNNKLRFVLYGPYSACDNGTREDQADGMTVSVAEDSESDATISDTDDDEPRTSRQGAGGKAIGEGNFGGQGLMSASGIRGLDGGWEMTFSSATYMDQVNYEVMEAFWTGIGDTATGQISQGINETDNLALTMGKMSLRLQSDDAISWNWVYEFAAHMMQAASGEFAPLFTGVAYSDYYVLAAIAVALSVI